MFGPGEGDIKEADVFSQGLPGSQLLVSRVGGSAAIARQAVVVGGIVEHDLARAAPADVGVSRDEGAVNDGVFQALAFVDSDEFNGVFVAFQPELMFIGGLELGVVLLGEPLEERARLRVGARGWPGARVRPGGAGLSAAVRRRGTRASACARLLWQ